MAFPPFRGNECRSAGEGGGSFVDLSVHVGIVPKCLLNRELLTVYCFNVPLLPKAEFGEVTLPPHEAPRRGGSRGKEGEHAPCVL